LPTRAWIRAGNPKIPAPTVTLMAKAVSAHGPMPRIKLWSALSGGTDGIAAVYARQQDTMTVAAVLCRECPFPTSKAV